MSNVLMIVIFYSTRYAEDCSTDLKLIQAETCTSVAKHKTTRAYLGSTAKHGTW